jgi:hypothetical protein
MPLGNTFPRSHKNAKTLLMFAGLHANSSMLTRMVVFCLEAR